MMVNISGYKLFWDYGVIVFFLIRELLMCWSVFICLCSYCDLEISFIGVVSSRYYIDDYIFFEVCIIGFWIFFFVEILFWVFIFYFYWYCKVMLGSIKYGGGSWIGVRLRWGILFGLLFCGSDVVKRFVKGGRVVFLD